MLTAAPQKQNQTPSQSKKSEGFFFQPKLTINQPNDIYEQEADAMADKVMRMTDKENMKQPFYKPAISFIQRKCERCEEEENRMQRKEMNDEEKTTNSGLEIYVGTLGSGGQTLPNEVRNFYEPRFGYDFSNVKVHTNSLAAKSAQSINALAYTSGNSIVFNEGQYAPDTDSGKRLLGHELTHVVQQQANTIQRAVRKGSDYAGSYEFDDKSCTLNYRQDWYFTFPSSMDPIAKADYMSSAESQVETVWSHRYPLLPSSAECPCKDSGANVAVTLNTFIEPRNGKHGYDVNVRDDTPEGDTVQPTRHINISVGDEVPKYMRPGLKQPIIGHEFGHTLGITDEYHLWAEFWNAIGHDDPNSIMYDGDQLRPRHYQHFADLLSNDVEGCQYYSKGFSSLSLANPVTRLGLLGARALGSADYILDLQVDRRLGNTDLLGWFTPRLGIGVLINTSNGNVMTGPEVSLDLNRIAHPLYVDIRTGLYYDPEDPGRAASLNLSPSFTLGLRGDGYSVGVNYTGLTDLLRNNGYTHMIGLELQVDLSR